MEVSKAELDHLTRNVEMIARQAGEYLISQKSKIVSGDIESKGHHDYVTYVDRNAENQIVDSLRVLLPEAGFLAEENHTEKGSSGLVWIIDPLDGTTNFIHKLPFFSVSIALATQDDILLGVVYEPNNGECFSTYKGSHSQLNGDRICVSATLSMTESLVATGFPYSDFSRLEAYLIVLRNVIETSRGVRRLGSAALDLAYVACGRFDAFFEYGLKPWDVAAGSILVKNAGGYIADFSGDQRFLYGKEILASNRFLSVELPGILKEAFGYNL